MRNFSVARLFRQKSDHFRSRDFSDGFETLSVHISTTGIRTSKTSSAIDRGTVPELKSDESNSVLSSYVRVARFRAERIVCFGRLAAHTRRWRSGSCERTRQERTEDKCDRSYRAGVTRSPLLGRRCAKRYRVACLALDGPFQVGYLDPASAWVQPVRSKDVVLLIRGCVGRARRPGDYRTLRAGVVEESEI